MSSHADSGGARPTGFQLPFLHTVEGLMHSVQGVHITYRQILVPFVIAVVVFFVFEPAQSILNFEFVFFLTPIWLPIYLYKAAHDRFGQYTKANAFLKNDYILLEIRIPRDTSKTPLAMETFFSSLNIGSGETTWYKRFVQGGTRPVWSFEIVSLGGRLHLYIHTREGYRRLVESFLYAQYPDIEIIEAEDYSRLVDPSEHGYTMWACEYTMKKPTPFPLKTYVDYKMEPGDKPEESVDPMSQMLETMASIGPGEQFWLQIIIRMTKAEKFKGLVNAEGKPYGWSDMVKEATEEIRSKTVRKNFKIDEETGKVIESETFPNPSKGQSEGIAAIERKANKQLFDVGVRAIYLAPDTAYQGIMVPSQINLFKAFNNEANGNSLVLDGNRWDALFNDLPWEDRGGHHQHHLKHEAVQVYRRRAYFHDPYVGPWMNMSTEELATLFHIPSSAVTTPNLERIQSSTANAPANLPN